jgi:F-type H+-transporting ATPase subunit b
VLIDWFTVAAQIVNFLILMALLKFFLYDRIIRAMDEREQKIRSRLQEAREKRAEAEEEGRSYREMQNELEERRESLLAQAKENADHRREELEEQARGEVDRLRRRWRDGLEKEKAAFVRNLRQMAGRRTLEVARTVLTDMADSELQKQVVTVFTAAVRELDDDGREALKRSAAADGNRMTVVSAIDLAADERRKLTRVLHETFGQNLDVEYDTRPELLMGVELKTPDKKVAWSVHDYLGALTEDVQAAIDAETRQADENRSERSAKNPRNETDRQAHGYEGPQDKQTHGSD